MKKIIITFAILFNIAYSNTNIEVEKNILELIKNGDIILDLKAKINNKDVSNYIKNLKSNKTETASKSKQELKRIKNEHFTRKFDIVSDHVTGLMWQDDINAKLVTKPLVSDENYTSRTYSNVSGDTASTYCGNLELAGFDDFRLPNIEELNSIVNAKNHKVYDSFENVVSYNYWSSSSSKSKYSNAWYLYTHLGYKDIHPKNYNLYVRCVRDNV